MKNIVVFASGSGSNLQAIINAIIENRIQAKITGLVASKIGIKAIDIAKANHIPVFVTQTDEDLIEAVDSCSPDLIVLAGYLKKIPAALIDLYPGKMINIHPSLLPKYGGKGFYGMNVHRAVIEAKEKESGCTVHIVTTEYDKGPIVAQARISVKPDFTPEDLAAAVLLEEHKLLPKVIQQIINTEN